MSSVPPPSRIAAPVRVAHPTVLQEGAKVALTTAVLASTVSFAVHAFGIPHEMHTGKSAGPPFLYLVLTVAWALRRRRKLANRSGWALAVFVGGGLANLAEAILCGGVTDFIPLHLSAVTFVFSAGDVAVLAGTAASCAAVLRR